MTLAAIGVAGLAAGIALAAAVARFVIDDWRTHRPDQSAVKETR